MEFDDVFEIERGICEYGFWILWWMLIFYIVYWLIEMCFCCGVV